MFDVNLYYFFLNFLIAKSVTFNPKLEAIAANNA
jgi:hypothetical protein